MQPLIMPNKLGAVFPKGLWTLWCCAIAVGVACGAFQTNSVNAAEITTQCDHLAAHPEDPDRITEGIPTAVVDQLGAIAACETDLIADPGNPRLTYQLARVYFYNGRSADAVATMEKAATAGYRQAQFVMGALINNNRPNASNDICDAEVWWAKSAQAGRLAAQVSYVRHVTKGLFNGCALHASESDMVTFLENVQTKGSGYYLRLLTADLMEDLAAYRSR